jgi:signal transduction histidine kinase
VRQQQFELIFNAIGEGAIVFNGDGVALESNPTAHEFVRMYEQLTGRTGSIRDWPILYADGSPMPVHARPLARALEHGEVARNVIVKLPDPSGDFISLSINASPVPDAATGRIEHVVVTFRDVTMQAAAERRVAEQNARLAETLELAEKANRAKTDFMGVMSHELRTPMNAVLGCAALLGHSQLDPAQARTLGMLRDAGQQMLALLNDLLDLSSLDAGKVRITREPVSLARLIEDAAVIWSADVRAKGLSLSVSIDPALAAPREMDAGRLLQVIGNLMSNAIKFTASGGVMLQARPEGAPGEARRVAIEVQDTGPGVSQDAIERIFLPFEQADVSLRRRHGGLGLGLHVARRLAHALGGDIALESRVGEGARFVVTVDAPLSGLPAEPDHPDAPAPAPDVSLDILCVDDNPRNLFVLSALLESMGHRPATCESGQDALDLLAARRFDVVLLDMVMPGLDGLEVLARLQARSGPNRATPVIACTANVLPDHVETYRRAGTAGVLAKPIDVRSLLQALREAS